MVIHAFLSPSSPFIIVHGRPVVHPRCPITRTASLQDPAAFLRVSVVEEGAGERGREGGRGRVGWPFARTFSTKPLFASVRVIRRSQMSQFSDTAVSRVGGPRENRATRSKVIYDERVKVFSAP